MPAHALPSNSTSIGDCSHITSVIERCSTTATKRQPTPRASVRDLSTVVKARRRDRAGWSTQDRYVDRMLRKRRQPAKR